MQQHPSTASTFHNAYVIPNTNVMQKQMTPLRVIFKTSIHVQTAVRYFEYC